MNGQAIAADASPGRAIWADAARAAALLAVDPHGLGGAAVRAPAGSVRDAWLALLQERASGPWCKVPLHVGDGRLLGGLDLAATLKAGRPVAEQGLLAQADGGIVLAAMAERLTPATVTRLTSALDAGAVVVERDGLALRQAARFGLVALDEGIGEDERASAALLDRLAFHLDLGQVAPRDATQLGESRGSLDKARARLRRVRVSEAIVAALCEASLVLGVGSLRGGILALRAAKAAAALAGRREVDADDAALAARLVLAPRATRMPVPQEAQEEAEQPPQEPPAEPPPDENGEATRDADLPLADILLNAAQAAIPPDLLARLMSEASRGRAPLRKPAAPASPRPRPAAGGRSAPGAGHRAEAPASA